MIDLFGISRSKPPDPAADPAPEPAPARPPRGSHRVWAFLLVLDSVFVIVFGGAVAAKVYQYWRPEADIPIVRRRPPKTVKPPEPVRPHEAPAAAPPAPEPAKASEPALKRAPRERAPRPPKPSLINEPPKPRVTPTPAPAAAPAAETAVKARAVVFKLHAPNARAVQLVGAFIVHGGRRELAKGAGGGWTLKLYLNPGSYRYFFTVDKKKVLDPQNPRVDRGASVIVVP